MIKGFFFDLDGTLVDTHRSNYEAYKQALADFGIAIDFNVFKKTIGMQAKDFLPILAPNAKADDYAAIAKHKSEYYEKHAHLSELNQSLVGFMLYMKQSGYKIVLVTTAKLQNARVIIRQHNLENIFDHMITNEDVMDSKPSPEAYMLALERSGLRAEEVITFEDSSTGQKAAQAAGIPVVMIKDYLA